MNRFVLRSVAGAAALAVAALGRGPAAPSGPAPAPLAFHRSFPAHLRLRGALTALHPATLVADLATPDGSLLPLRFAAPDQMRGLRPGDHLALVADARAHARLLVRAVLSPSSHRWRARDQSHRWRDYAQDARWLASPETARWLASTGAASHRWRVRGVIARTFGHGQAELLGVNGAATTVYLQGARTTAAGSAPSGNQAYAGSAPALGPGAALDLTMQATRRGALAAADARILATGARVDLEGTITRVDRRAGALTIVDECGARTVVHIMRVGPAARTLATYKVGASIEVANVRPAATVTVSRADIEEEPAVPIVDPAPPAPPAHLMRLMRPMRPMRPMRSTRPAPFQRPAASPTVAAPRVLPPATAYAHPRAAATVVVEDAAPTTSMSASPTPTVAARFAPAPATTPNDAPVAVPPASTAPPSVSATAPATAASAATASPAPPTMAPAPTAAASDTAAQNTAVPTATALTSARATTPTSGPTATATTATSMPGATATSASSVVAPATATATPITTATDPPPTPASTRASTPAATTVARSTSTPTSAPTATPTNSATATATSTDTPTSAGTVTPTATLTPTPMPTSTETATSTAPPTAIPTVSNAGLVGYWRFDEGTGATTADSSGNGNTGAFMGNPGAVNWVAGPNAAFNVAVNVDGSTGYIDAGPSETLDITGSVSVAAWVNITSTAALTTGANQKFMVREDLNTGGGYKFSIYSGVPDFEVRDANHTAYVDRPNGVSQYCAGPGGLAQYGPNGNGTVLGLNTWHHVVGVYSPPAGSQSGYIKTYVDGKLDRVCDTTGVLATAPSGTRLNIGGQFNGTSGLLDGQVDDMRIYNRALTVAEVQALATQP